MSLAIPTCHIKISPEGQLYRLRASFVALLRLSAKNKDLCRGIQIHLDLIRWGLLDTCSDALTSMYAACGALAQAKDLLYIYESKDVCTWTTFISACVEQGQARNALHYFEQMQDRGLTLEAAPFTCVLRACGSIKATDKGEIYHSKLVNFGLLEHDIILGTALVDMYAKCTALRKARQVLEGLPARNVVSWNALIVGYGQQDQGTQALICFEEMQREGILPDSVTLTSVLKSCASVQALDKGETLHAVIAKQGLLGHNFSLCTALVDMYIKCDALTKARGVLEELSSGNPCSWNALISRYVQEGHVEQALECFDAMQCMGFFPDKVTYISILKACSAVGAADFGEKFHYQIVKQNLLGNDSKLGSALVIMYAKCGALMRAQHVHHKLCVRDVVDWNALITGFIHNEEGIQALHCSELMQHEGLLPNEVTFICILKACGIVGAVVKGEKFHNEILKRGWLETNEALGTALVDMYAKCGDLGQAQCVFAKLPVQNIISWNALITGFAQQGKAEQAMLCFSYLQDEGLSPDATTWTCMLSACIRPSFIESAQLYLTHIIMNYGLEPNEKQFTCLVSTFGRAGLLNEAIKVIEQMPPLERAVWFAVLGACWKWGDVSVGQTAFEHILEMDKVLQHCTF